MPGDFGYQLGLLSGVRLTTMLRVIHRLPTVSPSRIPRLAALLAGSVVAAPFAAADRLLGPPAVSADNGGPPVFIIGHWRSGTTHLHNLMSRDPAWAYVDMFQALAPDYPRVSRSWLRPLLEFAFPAKRPMDNMEWPMAAPQEEEIPLAKMTPYSWYMQFLFPRNAVEIFDETVLLRGAAPKARREVMRKLTHLYSHAAQAGEGRRLLLKNPVNTARIPMLLERFPDARFIFIHRSPYDVFASSRHLHRKLLALTSLQTIDEETIDFNVLALYDRILRTYLADRSKLQSHQLIEVAFSDLETSPCTVLAKIYAQLDLGDFERLRPTVSEYVRSLATYQKNTFPPLTPHETTRVNQAWGFAFKEWGYELRT